MLGWRKILFYYKNQLVFRYLHLEHSKKFVVSSCQHLAQNLPKKSLEKSLQFPWDAELVSTISFIYLFLNSFVYLFILSWQITSVTYKYYKCYKYTYLNKNSVKAKAHSQVWDNFWQLKVLWKWCKMHFISRKAFFVLKISKFLSWLFGHVEKRLN